MLRHALRLVTAGVLLPTALAAAAAQPAPAEPAAGTRRPRDRRLATPLRLRLRRGVRALRRRQRALPRTPHRPLQPRHHGLEPAGPAQQRDARVEPPQRPLLLPAGPSGRHAGGGGRLPRAPGGSVPAGPGAPRTRSRPSGSALLPRRRRGARVRLVGDRGPGLVPRGARDPARRGPPPAGAGTRPRLPGRLRGPGGLRLRDRHPAAGAPLARVPVRDARRPGGGAARGGDHRERGPAGALGRAVDLGAADAARGAGGRGARRDPAAERAVPEEPGLRARRGQHPDRPRRFRGRARARRTRSSNAGRRASGTTGWSSPGSSRPGSARRSCSPSAGRRPRRRAQPRPRRRTEPRGPRDPALPPGERPRRRRRARNGPHRLRPRPPRRRRPGPRRLGGGAAARPLAGRRPQGFPTQPASTPGLERRSPDRHRGAPHRATADPRRAASHARLGTPVSRPAPAVLRTAQRRIAAAPHRAPGLERRSPDRHPRCSAPRNGASPPRRIARPAWNAGLQTGTRGPKARGCRNFHVPCR